MADKMEKKAKSLGWRYSVGICGWINEVDGRFRRPMSGELIIAVTAERAVEISRLMNRGEY